MGTRRDSPRGAGLGLSIVKGIVQAHGGRIGLEEIENGACFLVQLPAEGPAETWREPVDRRTKALLVEDDPNIVDLIRSNLTVRGYDTCSSARGPAPLSLSRQRPPTSCCWT